MSRRPVSRKRPWYRDPLNLTALGFSLVWGLMAILGRPIGDYGVETDFYGDFVPTAHRWMHDGPQVGNGFRGPFYYVLLGVLGQSFMAGKLLSVICSGVALRLVGEIVATLLDRRAALLAMLALAANAVFVELSFRAASDPIFFALFTGTLVLCLPKTQLAAKRKGEVLPETGHRPWPWLLAGVLAGSAWLTRYNGIALLPAGILFALFFARPRRLLATAAFLGGWFILALPWALFLWKKTGEPFWNTNYQNLAIAVYAPNPSRAQVGAFMKTVGFASIGEVLAVDFPHALLVLGKSLFVHFGRDVMTLVMWPWAVVSLAGYAITWRRWKDGPALMFLVAGLITYLSLLPAFHNPRFMLPLLIWWMTGVGAFGVAIPDLLKRRESKRRAIPASILVLLGLVVFTGARELRSSLDKSGPKGCPTEILGLEREAKRLRIPISETTPIAARKPQVGYYLGAPVVSLPFGNLEDLRQSGAHYVLVSGAEVMQSSNLMPLLNPREGTPIPSGLTLVAKAYASANSGSYRSAVLYALANPKPYTPPSRLPEAPRRDTLPGLSRLDTVRLRLARWLLIWEPHLSLSALVNRMSTEARTNPAVLALEGDEKLMRGDLAGANDLYTKMAASDAAQLRLAGVAYLEGDRGRMTAALKTLTGERTARDWYGLGSDQQARGEFAAAIAPLAACIEADSTASPCYERLGRTLLQAGKNEMAMAVLHEGLKRRPDDAELRDLLKQLESGTSRVALGPR